MESQCLTNVSKIIAQITTELDNLNIKYIGNNDDSGYSELSFDLGLGHIKIKIVGSFLAIWFELDGAWWRYERIGEYFQDAAAIPLVDQLTKEKKSFYLKKIISAEEFPTGASLLWQINHWHSELKVVFDIQKERLSNADEIGAIYRELSENDALTKYVANYLRNEHKKKHNIADWWQSADKIFQSKEKLNFTIEDFKPYMADMLKYLKEHNTEAEMEKDMISGHFIRRSNIQQPLFFNIYIVGNSIKCEVYKIMDSIPQEQLNDHNLIEEAIAKLNLFNHFSLSHFWLSHSPDEWVILATFSIPVFNLSKTNVRNLLMIPINEWSLWVGAFFYFFKDIMDSIKVNPSALKEFEIEEMLRNITLPPFYYYDSSSHLSDSLLEMKEDFPDEDADNIDAISETKYEPIEIFNFRNAIAEITMMSSEELTARLE